MTDAPNDLNGHVIMSSGITLIADEFVPIRIKYYEGIDSAFIKLSW